VLDSAKSWFSWIILAAAVLCGTSLHAQLTVGENTELNFSGILDFGYNGGYGEGLTSQHGVDIGGQGTLNGSYYNPKFLSFVVQPYYNRNQNNSESASLFSTSGVNASASIFSGSHFPGSISFSKAYNATGTFGIPGVQGLTTHGDGQSVSFSWSELLPDKPTLTATYTLASSNSDVYGADLRSNTNTHTLDLRSTYSLAGFQLNGYYTRLSMDGNWPDAFTLQNNASTNDSDNLGFYGSHTLPMHGSFMAGWNWSDYNSGFEGTNTSGSTNNLNETITINPFDKLTFYNTSNYIGNVAGAINRDIIQAGGLPVVSTDNGSHTFITNTGMNYQVLRNLAIQANVSQQEQWFGDGETYSATRFNGALNFGYAHRLLGLFAFSVGMEDTATEQGNSGAGLVASVDMDKRLGSWELSSDFSYNQAVQTYYAAYTTSSYSYGANVRRRFGQKAYWLGTYRGYRSGFVQYAGSGNSAENVGTSVFFRLFSLNANYSQSDGTSVYTPTGLVPLPPNVPPAITGSEAVLYNGRGYGGGFSLNAIRRMVFTVNYFKATSNTASPLSTMNNMNNMLNVVLRYPFRKMFFNAGYTRMNQDISNAGLPLAVNTYYIGVSRWFKFF
jgi:hypothetical protein